MIAFGPIPSRRLGKSLGINNIPGIKSCSYSCIYCQVGSKCRMTDVRRTYYQPEYLLREVFQHLALLGEEDSPDYLTFVANGEPTLDIHLGKEMDLLNISGIPVAVITNGSLLIDPHVRQDLFRASWV
ncbi:MAG: radical SAM protein, partial [Bacteroidales bacterium]|nr:radical SAM protein [Bacteroidales bacterium]